jgi:hypothetical protein
MHSRLQRLSCSGGLRYRSLGFVILSGKNLHFKEILDDRPGGILAVNPKVKMSLIILASGLIELLFFPGVVCLLSASLSYLHSSMHNRGAVPSGQLKRKNCQNCRQQLKT